MGGVRDELQMLSIGSARLPVVDGKGAEYSAILQGDWCGPASAQTVRQRHLATACPEWVGGDVGNHNRLLPVSSDPARAGARTDLYPVHCPRVFHGKAGSGAVPQGRTVGIQKKNGAEQAAMLLLDLLTEDFEDLRERSLGPDHPQHLFVELRQCLG